LSRVAPNGVDASRRPNRIAHHLVLEPHERALGGPAWMLGQFGAFETGTPEVAERATLPVLPTGDLPVRAAQAWSAAGFDAGWAGIVAQALVDHPQAVVYVVLPEALDALPLVIDVLALMPNDRRWHVTFSTRPLVVLPHVRCQLRFVRAEAPGLARMLAEPGARVVRVERDEDAGESDAANAARRGQTVEPTSRPVNTRVNPVVQSASGSSAAGVREQDAFTASTRAGAQMPPASVERSSFDDSFGAASQASLGRAGAGLVDSFGSARDSGAVPDVARGSLSSRSNLQWHPMAIALILYSGLAVLGAVILFLLAAFAR
ncbi:MAG: hypothetical protein RIR10_1738, partial [Planctomycetota bacterium]